MYFFELDLNLFIFVGLKIFILYFIFYEIIIYFKFNYLHVGQRLPSISRSNA